jgi:RND family efflux transporter MFP subunit
MSSEQTDMEQAKTSGKRKLVTLVVCLAILLGASGVLYVIYKTEPKAEPESAVRRSAMLVEVVKAERGNFRPVISALGTVEAAQDVMLRPRISGEVLSVSDSFEPGQIVKKGDFLLEIDPSDYRNALTRSQSELQQVEADLRLEMGQQEVAKEELKTFDGDLEILDTSLILRVPQLDSIKARVEAARAAVEQAKLDLERTKIVAPFDAQILARDANVGSQVGPNDTLGHLIGQEEYWVIVTIPLNKVYWLDFAATGESQGSNVILRNLAAWPEGVSRTGRAERLIGALDQETRLARVLVTVSNPLAQGEDPKVTPPLVVGSVLDAQIYGREIKDVIRIKRDHVREGNTVWLNRDGKLEINELSVVFQDSDYAYVKAGISDGDQIVITNLRTAAPGTELRSSDIKQLPPQEVPSSPEGKMSAVEASP